MLTSAPSDLRAILNKLKKMNDEETREEATLVKMIGSFTGENPVYLLSSCVRTLNFEITDLETITSSQPCNESAKYGAYVLICQTMVDIRAIMKERDENNLNRGEVFSCLQEFRSALETSHVLRKKLAHFYSSPAENSSEVIHQFDVIIPKIKVFGAKLTNAINKSINITSATEQANKKRLRKAVQEGIKQRIAKRRKEKEDKKRIEAMLASFNEASEESDEQSPSLPDPGPS